MWSGPLPRMENSAVKSSPDDDARHGLHGPEGVVGQDAAQQREVRAPNRHLARSAALRGGEGVAAHLDRLRIRGRRLGQREDEGRRARGGIHVALQQGVAQHHDLQRDASRQRARKRELAVAVGEHGRVGVEHPHERTLDGQARGRLHHAPAQRRGGDVRPRLWRGAGRKTERQHEDQHDRLPHA